VAVEKLFFGKMLKKTLRYDALQTTISIFWTFPIPRFWCVSHETGLFQQPQAFALKSLPGVLSGFFDN
jgi:hypothetical protein